MHLPFTLCSSAGKNWRDEFLPFGTSVRVEACRQIVVSHTLTQE